MGSQPLPSVATRVGLQIGGLASDSGGRRCCGRLLMTRKPLETSEFEIRCPTWPLGHGGVVTRNPAWREAAGAKSQFSPSQPSPRRPRVRRGNQNTIWGSGAHSTARNVRQGTSQLRGTLSLRDRHQGTWTRQQAGGQPPIMGGWCV